MNNDWVYDIEVFPNIFTIAFEHAHFPITVAFEISDWRNDSREIIEFISHLRNTGSRLIGFNNLGFDYPILHMLIKMGKADAMTLYRKAQEIIGAQDNDRFAHMVYPSDRFIDQIDLFKIHHFDNKAKSTSLKLLEFNMRMDSVSDLPFKVGSMIEAYQVDTLKVYNECDVAATKRFYHASLDMIRFREELTAKYGRDFMNHNDTKIGKDYFVMQLEAAGISCYDYSKSGRQPRQTKRPVIRLKEAILPWIKFDQPEFTRVLNWLKDQAITETKGVFDDLTATINGFTFVFGLGGIHGSVKNKELRSGYECVIESWDVASYYPNLAIANRFYPAHLGERFCDIYKSLFEQRKRYEKKSSESAMLKLALNGVYGDSNNPFSVFYDPLFTMSITLNGQLLLCLLAERLMNVPTVEIIMMNTDGVEYIVHPNNVDLARRVCLDWEELTRLTLENSNYRRMFIRDVNNYLAVYDDNSVKRKGAYEYELEWHQNASALVVPKVAGKVLLDNVSIRQTVENWPDPMDFMLRTKVPRSSYLSATSPDGQVRQVQNVTRYYVAKDGDRLTKWMPPLKGKTEWRQIGVESGWGVQVCNDTTEIGKPIDFDYYVGEVEKLVLQIA